MRPGERRTALTTHVPQDTREHPKLPLPWASRKALSRGTSAKLKSTVGRPPTSTGTTAGTKSQKKSKTTDFCQPQPQRLCPAAAVGRVYAERRSLLLHPCWSTQWREGWEEGGGETVGRGQWRGQMRRKRWTETEGQRQREKQREGQMGRKRWAERNRESEGQMGGERWTETERARPLSA